MEKKNRKSRYDDDWQHAGSFDRESCLATKEQSVRNILN